MVEVFATNIADAVTAGRLAKRLARHLPGSKISFDLEDCDRILRIESAHCPITVTEQLIRAEGYTCSVLKT